MRVLRRGEWWSLGLGRYLYESVTWTTYKLYNSPFAVYCLLSIFCNRDSSRADKNDLLLPPDESSSQPQFWKTPHIDQVDLIMHANLNHEFSLFKSSLITTVCTPYLWWKSDSLGNLKTLQRRNYDHNPTVGPRLDRRTRLWVPSLPWVVFPLPVPEVTNVSKARSCISRSTQALSVTLQQITQARCDGDGKSFCPHCSSCQEIPSPSVITVKMSWESSFGMHIWKNWSLTSILGTEFIKPWKKRGGTLKLYL